MTHPPTPHPLEQYPEWREWKLSAMADFSTDDPDALFVTIADANSPTKAEINALLENCKRWNMALYRFEKTAQSNKYSVHNLAGLAGLATLDSNLCADKDSLTSITQTRHQGQHEYIPYSNKQLSWHTDGYYNPPSRQINGMLLHCVQPARQGGMSRLMDPDIAYILLHDENPEWIRALMQADALTIPANELNGEIVRHAQSGPVFSFNQVGQLHMRYSARKRNIEWKQDTPILEAVAFLDSLWENAAKEDNPFILNHTLQAGEGLLCNNVLHCRTAFVDNDEREKKRLLYRGRYYSRVCDPNE